MNSAGRVFVHRYIDLGIPQEPAFAVGFGDGVLRFGDGEPDDADILDQRQNHRADSLDADAADPQIGFAEDANGQSVSPRDAVGHIFLLLFLGGRSLAECRQDDSTNDDETGEQQAEWR